MEMDEAFNPVEIGLLGARAVGFDADEVADAIEQKHMRNVHHQTGLFGPESPTIAMIFWDYAPASHRLFSRLEPNIPAKALHIFPALWPHTSRWASRQYVVRLQPTADTQGTG
jgi:hypothetical protein